MKFYSKSKKYPSHSTWSRFSFAWFSPRFSFKRSDMLRQVRAVRATGERRWEEKEFFRTFLSSFFLERDGRPIKWDIGNFIHGCQWRRTKLERRTSRRSSNGGGCKPCISFFPFNKGMRNDLGEAGRPKKVQ